MSILFPSSSSSNTNTGGGGGGKGVVVICRPTNAVSDALKSGSKSNVANAGTASRTIVSSMLLLVVVVFSSPEEEEDEEEDVETFSLFRSGNR